MMSSVGLADCDAMSLMGHRILLLTARPRKIIFPHTCWTNRFPFWSKAVMSSSTYNTASWRRIVLMCSGIENVASYNWFVGIVSMI